MTVVDPEAIEPAAPAQSRGDTQWHARLRLRLASSGGRTSVVERTERGRLSIQEPRTREAGGVCQVTVVYPPSGIASGERTRLKVDVTDAGRALVVTDGPLRLHRSAGPISMVERQLTVSDSAALEWLPHHSVVGSRANAQIDTRVILEEDACFIGWEVVTLGRHRDGSLIDDGQLQQRLEVRRAGEALINERVVVSDGSIRTSTGETAGAAFGTLVAASPDGLTETVADELLRSLTRSPHAGTVWFQRGALIARVPADDATQATERLDAIRGRLGPIVFGRPPLALRSRQG